MNTHQNTTGNGDDLTQQLDALIQYVRCYPVPDTERIARRKRSRHPRWAKTQASSPEMARSDMPLKDRPPVAVAQQRLSPEGRAIKAIGAPYEGWCLVFDTETTSDTAQRLRFGCYEIHGLDRQARIRIYRKKRLTRAALDRLHAAGIFYDPEALTAEEIARIKRYAAQHHLACLTRSEFVDLFYKWAVRFGALVIGHNLPFDLSRLATTWTEATGAYRGGFTLRLCDCPHGFSCFDHPPIRVKLLAKYKARITFQKVKPLAKHAQQGKTIQGASQQQANQGRRIYATRVVEGRFLDTATLGRALLGPGDTTLAGLGMRFKVKARKATTDEHGGPLTDAYLDYARQDVASTWALYQAERDLYRRHGVGKPMWGIYSEASLGKAYKQELGIPPFLRAHPEVPPEVHGYGMLAYYGGRSEVHSRLQPTEVLYCDFKSQYPTANAIMGLQDLLLARSVTVRDATADVCTLLASFTLDQLQSPAFWRRLRVLVKIKPAGDLLPVRAEYGPDGRNIALAYVDAGPATWYALADVLASTLLTGKPPDVLAAVDLVPSSERVETKPWNLFGDERYTIDLSRQDFFTEVINLRSEVKSDLQRAKQEGRERDAHHLEGLEQDAQHLDGLQLGLKLLANSTSYGVLVEVNAEEPTSEPQGITLYHWGMRSTRTTVMEQPGTYFAGAVGALIPAGGRLLLALAERLGADRGLTYAMCDTDNMAFARPDGPDDMERETFRARVREIRDWFTPLSPYRGQPPIFEDEEVNQWQGEREPLFFLGVSTKRYALYNRLSDGSYRLRKFSSHGVGTWKSREGYISPPHIPAPCAEVHALGGERWHYDLWYEAIRAIDGGALPDGTPLPRDERGVPQYSVPDSEWLSSPAFHQVTISTAQLLRAYRDVPDIRPFSFLTVLPALDRRDIFLRQIRGQGRANAAQYEATEKNGARYDGLASVTFYAPYSRSAADLRDIRRSDTHELVQGIAHRTLAETLRDYYRHLEWKSGDPHGVGLLPRRHVLVLWHEAIGKESNRQALAMAEDTDGTVGGEEAGMDAAQVFDVGSVVEMLRRYSVADLARMTGVPRRTLYHLRNGTIATPDHTTLAALAFRLLALHSPATTP